MDSDKPGIGRNVNQLGPQKSTPGYGLEFSNLSYSIIKKQKKDGVWINKETYLLHDISGQAIKGEIMAVMGPSGAGKSTFLDALAGRIARGSLEGSVRIDGKPVKMSSSNFLIYGSKSDICFTFHQKREIFSLSILFNLITLYYGADYYKLHENGVIICDAG